MCYVLGVRQYFREEVSRIRSLVFLPSILKRTNRSGRPKRMTNFSDLAIYSAFKAAEMIRTKARELGADREIANADLLSIICAMEENGHLPAGIAQAAKVYGPEGPRQHS